MPKKQALSLVVLLVQQSLRTRAVPSKHSRSSVARSAEDSSVIALMSLLVALVVLTVRGVTVGLLIRMELHISRVVTMIAKVEIPPSVIVTTRRAQHLNSPFV